MKHALPLDRSPDLLATIGRAGNRPLLLAGGTVISMNRRLGDWSSADVLIGRGVIVGVGPGLRSAAEDDGMLVVDCMGCVVLPSAVNFADPLGGGSLTPGCRADIAVLRPLNPAGATDPTRVWCLDILLVDGRPRLWDGRPAGAGEPHPVHGEAPAEDASSHPRLGLWVDDTGFVQQALLPDGHYDESRGDRKSAYRGQWWIRGDRIDYLDDLGFWAFGTFEDDTLHHAGYRFTRRS